MGLAAPCSVYFSSVAGLTFSVIFEQRAHVFISRWATQITMVSKRQCTPEKLLKERCPLGQLLADSQSVTFWKTGSRKISGCQEVEVHGAVIFLEGVS